MATLDETHIVPETMIGSAPADDAASGAGEVRVNEIVKAAQDAKDADAKAGPAEKRGAWLAAGVGVGIGSAALVAALLYANREKISKR